MDLEKIDTNYPRCSFCGKTQKEVGNLVEGTEGVKICQSCASVTLQIIEEKIKSDNNSKKNNLTPKELYTELDRYVIGQESAKKVLSVEVREHFKRISATKTNYTELEKSNILMIGPTGCGKTLLLKTISKILDVPFVMGDATTFTQAGYVGNDVESVLSSLLSNCDYDQEKAERGIVFIDEIDKISRKGSSPSITRDVNGEGVQQALLKMIEGSECLIPADGSTRKHPQQKTICFNTQNVLFVFGGSFDGLSEIIKKRISVSATLGFNGTITNKKENNNINDFLPLVTTEDLIKYGIIPELLGRIPIRATLRELNKDELKKVLIEPNNSIIKQYKYSFELDGATLNFTDECYDLIVERAFKRKVGARGLRSIVNEVIKDTQFSLPDMVLSGKTEINFTQEQVKDIFNKIDILSKI
jgi:ATP-dependent Clp protease ATP-binding subunit ClpX